MARRLSSTFCKLSSFLPVLIFLLTIFPAISLCLAEGTKQPEIIPSQPITKPQLPQADLRSSSAAFRALDRVTGKSVLLYSQPGKKLKYGSLVIEVKVCTTHKSLYAPDDSAFLVIWDERLSENLSKPLFRGWMFASSPSLSALDHLRYDVWLVECRVDR